MLNHQNIFYQINDNLQFLTLVLKNKKDKSCRTLSQHQEEIKKKRKKGLDA